MSVLLFCVALLFGATSEVSPETDIAKINKLKREAKAAFSEGQYKEAAALYSVLIDSLGLQTPSLLANRAHALFSANEHTSALNQYQLLLSKSKDSRLRSIALNQIGLLSDGKVEKEQLLSFFKRALKADPANEKARYNYQRIMQRIYEENQEDSDQNDQKEQNEKQQSKSEQNNSEDQQQRNKEQENKENKSKDTKQSNQQDKKQSSPSKQEKDQKGNKNKEEKQKDPQSGKKEEESQDKKESTQSQKKEDRPNNYPPPSASTAEKLHKMNLSEEKARQILEALRHNEVQYLQQLRRKATQPKDESKPDW